VSSVALGGLVAGQEPAATAVRPRSGVVRPFAEFLVTGGATLLLFPLSWVARRALGLDAAELAVGFTAFYAAYVINDPHFTVTYLLFYRDAWKKAFGPGQTSAQRIRYLLAGVVVPLGLLLWGVTAIALRSAQTLGWMVQAMFLLVGWHYVKQGFGAFIVLSGRRGVAIDPWTRRAVLAHCLAGWAFAWANPAAPAGEFEEKGVVYWALPHPRALEVLTGGLLAASVLFLVLVLVRRWRRAGTFVPVAPLAGVLVTIWSWTIFSSVDPLVRYVIPALHSVQYLYFVWLMRRNEARAAEGPPSFGRPASVRLGVLALSALALGWVLFHGLPSFLDAAFVPRVKGVPATPGLGDTPFFAALYVFVNIHHYFMDGVIWRRENADTRWLSLQAESTT
jgi:hypothetical protein